ncbi:MAG TPA: hypothetical protein VEI02_10190, partial [Planctomycetota bacterium]|nr:hypothetical protein [Planctomycetota bacterium]
MEFAAPDRFALGWIAGALLLLAAVFGRRRRGPIWTGASVTLRAASIGLFLVGAAAPFVRRPEAPRPRVDVVLDVSRSVPIEARVEALRRAAEWAAAGAADVRVLAFDDRTRELVRFPAGAPAPRFAGASEGGGFASDPHAALAAAALDAAPGGARLVLWTDGRTPPPDAAFAPAPERRPLVLPLAANVPRGVRAERLVAEPPAADGEVVAVFEGIADRPLKGVVRATVDGQDAVSLPFEAAPGRFTVRLPFGRRPGGRLVLGARAEVADGVDLEPLDDAAGVVVRTPTPPSILIASPDARPLVASALRAQGLEPTVVAADALIADPAVADRAGVLVLDRVAVADLSRPAVTARLDAFLRRGGGVLFLPRDPETARDELTPAPERRFVDLLPLFGAPEPPPAPEKPP